MVACGIIAEFYVFYSTTIAEIFQRRCSRNAKFIVVSQQNEGPLDVTRSYFLFRIYACIWHDTQEKNERWGSLDTVSE